MNSPTLQSHEVDKFKDTGKTVTHRGREYSILIPEDGKNRDLSPYVLLSKRGVHYALIRNKPRPEHLFGVRLYVGTSVLPGWFTDKDGELKSLG